jgi:hypothetical protein
MRSSLYEQLERDRLEPRAARLVLERRERELAELRSALVSFQVDLAIVKLKRFLARKYRADQPRVPAGSPDGGRWALGEGRPSGRTRVGDTPTIRVAAEITGFTKHGINRAIEWDRACRHSRRGNEPTEGSAATERLDTIQGPQRYRRPRSRWRRDYDVAAMSNSAKVRPWL